MMRPLRILFIMPHRRGEACSETLDFALVHPIERCGLAIETAFHSYTRDLADFDENIADLQAMTKFRLFRPDIVIVSQYWVTVDLPIHIAQEMRNAGAILFYQLWDTPFFIHDHFYDILKTYHYVSNSENISMIHSLEILSRLMGLTTQFGNTTGIFCFDDARPAAATRDIDFLFAGTTIGELRAAALKRMEAVAARRGVVYRRAGGLSPSQDSAGWISWSDYFDMVGRARIGLSAGTTAKMNQVRGKPFEYMHGGAYPLIERHFDTELFFPQDIFELYADPDELEEKMDLFIDDPALLERKTKLAIEWWRDVNNWCEYWRNLLLALVGAGPGFPQRAALAAFHDRFAAARRGAAGALGPYVDACARLTDLAPQQMQLFPSEARVRTALTPPEGTAAHIDQMHFPQEQATFGIAAHVLSAHAADSAQS